jgi:hypothetical protein
VLVLVCFVVCGGLLFVLCPLLLACLLGVFAGVCLLGAFGVCSCCVVCLLCVCGCLPACRFALVVAGQRLAKTNCMRMSHQKQEQGKIHMRQSLSVDRCCAPVGTHRRRAGKFSRPAVAPAA